MPASTHELINELLHTLNPVEQLAITWHCNEEGERLLYKSTITWDEFLVCVRTGEFNVLYATSHKIVPFPERIHRIHAATISLLDQNSRRSPYITKIIEDITQNSKLFESVLRLESLWISLTRAIDYFNATRATSLSDVKKKWVQHLIDTAEAAIRTPYLQYSQKIIEIPKHLFPFMSHLKSIDQAEKCVTTKKTLHSKSVSHPTQVLCIYNALNYTAPVRILLNDVLKHFHFKSHPKTPPTTWQALHAWIESHLSASQSHTTWYGFIYDEHTGEVITTEGKPVVFTEKVLHDPIDQLAKQLIENTYQWPCVYQCHNQSIQPYQISGLNIASQIIQGGLHMTSLAYQTAPELQPYLFYDALTSHPSLGRDRLENQYRFIIADMRISHVISIKFHDAMNHLSDPLHNIVALFMRDPTSTDKSLWISYAIKPNRTANSYSGIICTYMRSLFESNYNQPIVLFENERISLIQHIVDTMHQLNESKKVRQTYLLGFLMLQALTNGVHLFSPADLEDEIRLKTLYESVIASLRIHPTPPAHTEQSTLTKKKTKRKNKSSRNMPALDNPPAIEPLATDSVLPEPSTQAAIESSAEHGKSSDCVIATETGVTAIAPVEVISQTMADQSIHTEPMITTSVASQIRGTVNELSDSCTQTSRHQTHRKLDTNGLFKHQDAETQVIQQKVKSRSTATAAPLENSAQTLSYETCDATTDIEGFKENAETQTVFTTLNPSELHASHIHMPLGDFINIVRSNCIPEKINALHQMISDLPIKFFLPQGPDNALKMLQDLQSHVDKMPLSRFYTDASQYLQYRCPAHLVFLESLIRQVFKESFMPIPHDFFTAHVHARKQGLFAEEKSTAQTHCSEAQTLAPPRKRKTLCLQVS